MSAMICRSGLIESHPDDERMISLNARMHSWLAEVEAEPELEPWERAALSQPLGTLTIETRSAGSWRSEGLAVLGWALGRWDLPPHDQCVAWERLLDAFAFLQPAAVTLPGAASLRSTGEIDAAAHRAFTLHWRLRHFSLAPCHMNFLEEAGQENLEGVPLSEADLSIDGVPIARAATDTVQRALAIAAERHRAFNWLRGYNPIYSETDIST